MRDYGTYRTPHFIINIYIGIRRWLFHIIIGADFSLARLAFSPLPPPRPLPRPRFAPGKPHKAVSRLPPIRHFDIAMVTKFQLSVSR